MKIIRKIIEIDEEKCDGCGNCVPSCAEGAIEIIDGKAKVVKDQYCDGLGACLGSVPRTPSSWWSGRRKPLTKRPWKPFLSPKKIQSRQHLQLQAAAALRNS